MEEIDETLKLPSFGSEFQSFGANHFSSGNRFPTYGNLKDMYQFPQFVTPHCVHTEDQPNRHADYSQFTANNFESLPNTFTTSRNQINNKLRKKLLDKQSNYNSENHQLSISKSTSDMANSSSSLSTGGVIPQVVHSSIIKFDQYVSNNYPPRSASPTFNSIRNFNPVPFSTSVISPNLYSATPSFIHQQDQILNTSNLYESQPICVNSSQMNSIGHPFQLENKGYIGQCTSTVNDYRNFYQTDEQNNLNGNKKHLTYPSYDFNYLSAPFFPSYHSDQSGISSLPQVQNNIILPKVISHTSSLSHNSLISSNSSIKHLCSSNITLSNSYLPVTSNNHFVTPKEIKTNISFDKPMTNCYPNKLVFSNQSQCFKESRKEETVGGEFIQSSNQNLKSEIYPSTLSVSNDTNKNSNSKNVLSWQQNQPGSLPVNDQKIPSFETTFSRQSELRCSTQLTDHFSSSFDNTNHGSSPIKLMSQSPSNGQLKTDLPVCIKSPNNSRHATSFFPSKCLNTSQLKIDIDDTQPASKLNEQQQRLDRLRTNGKMEPIQCNCISKQEISIEPVQYYDHLGSGESIAEMREKYQKNWNVNDNQLRFEKLLYTGKEGKTSQGCPIAKWVIRRSGPDEKYLVLVKKRDGHHCSRTWVVVVIVAWEGVFQAEADNLYDMLVGKLTKFGLPTQRRCGLNDQRTCACQGTNNQTCGASFSFGCSWSMYYNGCKYARSKNPRKFRLTEQNEELEVEEKLQHLATNLSPLYKMVAPESYHNQTEFEHLGLECRLGNQPGRPWSGVTACIDFCAHAHKDSHNMNNGCTVVTTLTKHRGFNKPDDEQLHVLPLYVLDSTDEYGSLDGQRDKVKNGSVEHLTEYPMHLRLRNVPLESCRKRAKAAKEKKILMKERAMNQTSASAFKTFGNPVGLTGFGETNGINKAKRALFSENIQVEELNIEGFSTKLIDEKHNSFSKESYDLNFLLQTHSQNANLNILNKMYPNLQAVHEESESPSVQTVPNNGQLESANSNCHQMKYLNNVEFQANTAATDCEAHLIQKSPNESISSSILESGKINIKVEPGLNGHVNQFNYPNYSFLKKDIKNELEDYANINQLSANENYNSMPSHPMLSSNGCETNQTSRTKEITNVDHKTNIVNKHFEDNKPLKNDDMLNENYVISSVPFKPYVSASINSANFSNSLDCPNAYTNPRLSGQFPLSSSNKEFNLSSNLLSPRESFQANSLNDMATPHNIFTTPPSHSTHVNPSMDVDSDGFYEVYCSNQESFSDNSIGGVAIALAHGSVLFECAKNELHATTALKTPNRYEPKRISLVFYQHKNMNLRHHGMEEYEKKKEKKKTDEALAEYNFIDEIKNDTWQNESLSSMRKKRKSSIKEGIVLKEEISPHPELESSNLKLETTELETFQQSFVPQSNLACNNQMFNMYAGMGPSANGQWMTGVQPYPMYL